MSVDQELQRAVEEAEAESPVPAVAQAAPTGPDAPKPKRNLGLLIGLLVMVGGLLGLVLLTGGSEQIYSVGVELENAQTQEANWRSLVSSVRSRYSGELVYGANWGNPAIGNAVQWWDAIDYIGIDAYYPLTGTNNPTPAQLQTAWVNRANQIEAWRNSVAPTKRTPPRTVMA